MRIVLIAASERDAERWIARQPSLAADDVVWVSPRSPARARGRTADVVLSTSAAWELEPDVWQGLVAETLPTVATSPAGGSGVG